MSDDKEIEVVNGNGEELEISQVYEHLEIEKPNMEKKKDIVVPKVKKKEEKESVVFDTEHSYGNGQEEQYGGKH